MWALTLPLHNAVGYGTVALYIYPLAVVAVTRRGVTP